MPDRNNQGEPRPLKIVIVLSCVSPGRPDASAVAFRYAVAAAAMDIEVEIHAVSASVELLRRGVAEKIFPEGADAPALFDQIRRAAGLGVKIFACPAAMAQYRVGEEDLVDEVAGIRGAASMISAGLESGARFLTF